MAKNKKGRSKANQASPENKKKEGQAANLGDAPVRPASKSTLTRPGRRPQALPLEPAKAVGGVRPATQTKLPAFEDGDGPALPPNVPPAVPPALPPALPPTAPKAGEDQEEVPMAALVLGGIDLDAVGPDAVDLTPVETPLIPPQLIEAALGDEGLSFPLEEATIVEPAFAFPPPLPLPPAGILDDVGASQGIKEEDTEEELAKTALPVGEDEAALALAAVLFDDAPSGEGGEGGAASVGSGRAAGVGASLEAGPTLGERAIREKPLRTLGGDVVGGRPKTRYATKPKSHAGLKIALLLLLLLGMLIFWMKLSGEDPSGGVDERDRLALALKEKQEAQEGQGGTVASNNETDKEAGSGEDKGLDPSQASDEALAAGAVLGGDAANAETDAESADSEAVDGDGAKQDDAKRGEQEEQELAAKKAEAERIAAERLEEEKEAARKAEEERLLAEKAEEARVLAEKLAEEKAAEERAALEKEALAKAEAERAALERVAAEKALAESAAREKAERELAAAKEKAAEEKAAKEKAAQEKAAEEKAAKEKAAAEKAAKEKAAAEKAAAEKAAAEKAAAEKAAKEKAAQAVEGDPLAKAKAAAAKLKCPAQMARMQELVGAKDSPDAYYKVVCIDLHEYPGAKQMPKTNVDLGTARSLCAARGKRLCEQKEWRRACGAKYSYGANFDPSRCNTAALDGTPSQILPAGSKGSCKSALGVYDMVGNVAEWTADGTINGGTGLKNSDDATCYAASRRAGGAAYVGFRCCADGK